MEKNGIFDKYIVKKINGETDPSADYFVLRLDRDPHARAAAKAYADSIKSENINLAMDIYAKVMRYEQKKDNIEGITEFN